MQRRTIALASVAASLGVLIGSMPGGAAAAEYPSKPISLVVPAPPGGSTDKLGRLLGGKLSASLGQPVVLDFKPGASGLIAEETVAKSAPDGHVLLLDQSSIAMNPVLFQGRMRFDLQRDLRPVSNIVRFQQMLVVSPTLPVQSVRELVAYAKAMGKAIDYSTPGPGTPQHLLAEMFLRDNGITATHVPYKGGAPALLAVATGEVQLTFLSVSTGQAMVQGRRVRAVGVLDEKRAKNLPEVPTFQEQGFRAMPSPWLGIFVTGNTPDTVVRRLNQDLIKILNLPEVRERLEDEGMHPIGNSAVEFARQLEQELTLNRKLVQELQIKAD